MLILENINMEKMVRFDDNIKIIYIYDEPNSRINFDTIDEYRRLKEKKDGNDSFTDNDSELDDETNSSDDDETNSSDDDETNSSDDDETNADDDDDDLEIIFKN